MIGQQLIGMTLVVNIAMRWPYLVPVALVAAVSASVTPLHGSLPPGASIEAPVATTFPVELEPQVPPVDRHEPPATSTMGASPAAIEPAEAALKPLDAVPLAAIRPARVSPPPRVRPPDAGTEWREVPVAIEMGADTNLPGLNDTTDSHAPEPASRHSPSDSDSDDSPGTSQYLAR